MADSHPDRLARARIALEGLSVGDAFGGVYEGIRPELLAQLYEKRIIPESPWLFTDDTNMAMSVYASLRLHEGIEQDWLAASFGAHFDIDRGYAAGMFALLPRYALGESWRELAPALFNGTGSFGNGSAMRIGPVGGYFADDLDACADHARRSAEVTHAHPEAAAGAIAAAIAGAVAWQLREANPRPTLSEFVDRVLPFVPGSEVRAGIERAAGLLPGTTAMEAAHVLGNGSRVTCQDTVPFCLWSAIMHLDNYENAIWETMRVGGDVDTTAAIVGGIVALSVQTEGIPVAWRAAREPLRAWSLGQG